MGFGVIAAENLIASELDGVVATDEGDVVREFVAAEDGEIGQEYIGAEIVREPSDLHSHLSRLVGDDVEAVVIPLEAELVLGERAEDVIPGGLKIVVVVVDRSCRRKNR